VLTEIVAMVATVVLDKLLLYQVLPLHTLAVAVVVFGHLVAEAVEVLEVVAQVEEGAMAIKVMRVLTD